MSRVKKPGQKIGEKIYEFVKTIQDKNPSEPEFLQAVKEVAVSVIPFIQEHPHYEKAKILERMCEPERAVIFRVAWMDDKGEFQINRGYRIQMNSAIGPYKGGLRFHPSVNCSILKFLAFEQVFKNSLTSLPMGGGKGGSDFDPKGKSDNEIMRFCQSFMTELAKHIGPDTDVPAGDIGVGAREIGFLFGQYKRLRNEFTGVLTGKGLPFGGSLLRPEATGYGVVYFAQNMLNETKDNLAGKTCVVSGSGNVAQFTVEKLLQLYAKVITMSDSDGYIHDKDGFTQEKLEFVKTLKNQKRGRISDYAKKFHAQYYEKAKPWNETCDIAFPCATQNELNLEDAKKLVTNGCKMVVEGANMPTMAEAVDYLHKKKILFSPGKASNAGGVAVSGLEMTQNSTRMPWPAIEVDHKLKQIMGNIHRTCVSHGTEEDGYINYVKGANIGGFIKVADAMLAQGLV